MKSRTSGFWRLVAIGAVLTAAACQNEKITVPTPQLTVSVAPQNSQIAVGETVQMVATVSPSTASQSVTWASQSQSIATVNASGLVTGVAEGTAVITATASDGTVGTASVQVSAGGSSTQPTVSIISITNPVTGATINPTAVGGTVDVNLNVNMEAGQVGTIKLFIGQTNVCEQTVSGGASVESTEAVQTVVCNVNTAAFDAGTPQGTPHFLNDMYDLNASLEQDGQQVASASEQIVIFNANIVVVSMSAPNTATNPNTGLSWIGNGDVTATAMPVIYGPTAGGSNVDRVTFTLNAPAGSNTANGTAGTAVQTDLDGSDGFSAVFPKSKTLASGGSGNVENTNATVSVATIISTFNGPNGVSTSAQLDNVAPVVTLFDITPATLGCANPGGCFVNGAFTFAIRPGFFAAADAGVDNTTATFAAGPAAGPFVDVTSGADLAETVTPTLVLRATVVDGLGNSKVVFASANAAVPATTVAGSLAFGIDLTNPTAAFAAGPANNSTNTGNFTWQISFSDAGVGPSGFGVNPVQVRLMQVLPGGSTCYQPDNAFTGTVVPCTTAGGAVNYIADDGTVALDPTVPGTGDGYWVIEAFVVDQAGNASTTLMRVTLNDLTAPVVGGISSPSSLPGGASASFSAAMSDNVDLGSFTPYYTFTTGDIIEYPAVTLGTYGTDALVSTVTGVFTDPFFLKSLESTTLAGRASTTTETNNTVSFDVFDVAGNTITQTTNINGAVLFADPNAGQSLTLTNPTVFAPANAAHGNFLQLAPTNATVCNAASAAACTTNPTTTTLSATMTGPNATFANPFVAVNFYYASGGRFHLIGAGTAAATDNTVTSTRTWTYTVTSWDPPASLGTAAAIPVVAIGITSGGKGLVSNAQNVQMAAN